MQALTINRNKNQYKKILNIGIKNSGTSNLKLDTHYYLRTLIVEIWYIDFLLPSQASYIIIAMTVNSI